VEFWTSVRTIGRRWYVALGTLLFFALLGTALVRSVSPQYDAVGSVVLLNMAQPTDPDKGPVNPFQTADYQANVFAQIMVEVLTDDVMRDELEARGVGRDYVIANSTNQTPVLFVTVHASTPNDALASYQIVTDQLRVKLRERQAAVKAPSQTYYNAVDLSVPGTPQPKLGSKIQAGLFVGVIAVASAVGLALLTEAIAQAQAGTRRPAREDEDDEVDAGAAAGPPPRDEPEVPVDGGPPLPTRVPTAGDVAGWSGQGDDDHRDEDEDDSAWAPTATATAAATGDGDDPRWRPGSLSLDGGSLSVSRPVDVPDGAGADAAAGTVALDQDAAADEADDDVLGIEGADVDEDDREDAFVKRVSRVPRKLGRGGPQPLLNSFNRYTATGVGVVLVLFVVAMAISATPATASASTEPRWPSPATWAAASPAPRAAPPAPRCPAPPTPRPPPSRPRRSRRARPSPGRPRRCRARPRPPACRPPPGRAPPPRRPGRSRRPAPASAPWSPSPRRGRPPPPPAPPPPGTRSGSSR
jgi:hypothetical protein